MKVQEAELHMLEVPLNDSYATSHHDALPAMEVPLVVLSDDSGNMGVGTAEVTEGYSHQSPSEVYSGLREEILPLILENNPTNPNELLQLLTTVDAQINAKGAAQMAALDLYGHQRGESVADILGGALTTEERLNGWVGIGSPEAMVAELQTLKESGFTSAKIKLAGDKESDNNRIEAVCEAAGSDMKIRFDANCGYESVEDALDVAETMASYDVVHFEQPISMEDLDGLDYLAKSADVPIMADEPIRSLSDAFEILSRGAVDRMKFKVLRLGGVMEAKTAFSMADIRDMDCVLGHGFGLAPSTSAEVQLASTCQNVVRPLECVGSYKFDEQPFEDQLNIQNAVAAVPQGPGLGVTLDEDALPTFSTESTTIS